MKIDSEFVYTVSFTEKEINCLQVELFKLDLDDYPTLKILYNMIIRA